VLARQIGGRPLLALHDPAAAATPSAACLAGSSDGSVAQLNWRAPAAGGAEIERYRLYRSESGGAQELAAETSGPQLKLADAQAPEGAHHYTYVVKAVNANGEGAASNPIVLDVTGTGGSVAPPTTPASGSDSRFGGALPLATLVALGFAALRRRRNS
jgi:MYXO-CTERM domain-containing protein